MKHKNRRGYFVLFVLRILIFLVFVIPTVWSNDIEPQWAKSVTSSSGDLCFVSITADSNGNMYASGYLEGTSTYDFGNGVTVNGTYSGHNAVLAKYDSNGNAQWAKSVVSGSDKSSFKSVAVDSSGDIYISGYIGSSSYDFGNGVTISGSYYYNTVLIKYDSSGNAQWAKSLTGGLNDSWFASIAVDDSGNIYSSGCIYGTSAYDFGNEVTVSGPFSSRNIVLVKYDSSGNAKWAKSVVGGLSDSDFKSVTIDSSGNIYALGCICKNSTYDFGNGVTVSGPASSSNTVLVKYDNGGNAQWAKSLTSGSGNSEFFYLVLDNNGNIYAAGIIYGTSVYDFGNGVTVSGPSSSSNTVLVKYDNSGNAQWAKSVTSAIGGSNASGFASLAVDDSGNIYASGYIFGTSTYNFGNEVNLNAPYSSANVLLVKYDSSGNTQWAKSVISSSGSSGFYSVTVDANENIYAPGYIKGSFTFNFGNGVAVNGSCSVRDALLVKYFNINNVTLAIETTSAMLSYNFCDYMVVDNNIKITSVNSASIKSAKVILSNADSFESLKFTDQNGIVGEYNSKTGELSLTGSASVDDYQTALRSVEYKNDKSLSKTTTVSFVVNNGNSDSNIARRKINVEQSKCSDGGSVSDDESLALSTTSQVGVLSVLGASLALIL